MRHMLFFIFTVAQLSAVAQNFNTVHDYGRVEFGQQIFYDSLNDDGRYPFHILGESVNPSYTSVALFFMNVSADGQQDTIVSKVDTNYQGSRCGNYRSAKRLADGSFVAPYNWTYRITTHASDNLHGGLVRFDNLGGSMYTRTYSIVDSVHYMMLSDVDVVPGNNGFLLAGSATDTGARLGWLVRTDANGNKLNEHFYQPRFVSIQALDTNRFLVGGHTQVNKSYNTSPNPGISYWLLQPYFAIIDTAGTILKDTSYLSGFIGNSIYYDQQGGYYHFGAIDTTVPSTSTSAVGNFPNYLAHLDTNFRMQWITRFSDGVHRFVIINVRQLRDHSFLVMGVSDSYYDSSTQRRYTRGWAARVSVSGNIIWSKTYSTQQPSTYEPLMDAVQRNDGSIVFSGAGGMVQGSGPAYVWTLSVDSNGCELCNPTTIQPSPRPVTNIRIFPNPGKHAINVALNQTGSLIVYDLQGKQLASFILSSGLNQIQLPADVPAGVYIARAVLKDGSIHNTRLSILQ